MENVTTERFKELQAEGNKLLVDFWAKWCGPCKTLIPRLEQMEGEYPDVKFIKIDVDDNMDTSLDMGIRSVPTVMIFNGDKLVDRSQGVQSDKHYKDVLNKL
jgi:thioredoxin 1